MRRAAFALLLLLSASCGKAQAPLPTVDVRIQVEAETRRVHPGEGFRLDVVRTWKRELDPSPWDDGMLSPLVVREESVERRDDGRRIQERRRFRAYVFSLKDARVPAVPFAARPADGGELRIAASRPLRLRVEPELDPKAPGMPELPGALPGARGPWGPLLVGLGLLLAVGAFVAVRRRSLEPPSTPPEPHVAPEVRAHQALARIREQEGSDPVADIETIARIVRDFAGARFGVDAEALTSEELERLAGAGSVLLPADRVKFGAHRPDAAERAALLDEAEGYVRRTAR